jgi:hypothetical protein
LISKPSSFAFDVAVSSVEYDARVLRELERQLTLRLPSMPPLRPVWTSVAAELLNAPRTSVFGKTARIVVVLHQHLWGKDETTKADVVAIKRRVAAKGANSVRVVLLDRTPLPPWLRKSPARSLGELGQCADWIVDAVAELGGATRRAADLAVLAAPLEERSMQQRDSFLASHRAITHLGREFDRLAAEVTKRVATVNRDDTEIPLEVHRVPGRCTVQLGPVALTLSWVRTRPDNVATGRLMIIEWEGQVGRVGTSGGPSAIPVRETILRADATRVEDWQWKSDDVAGYAYDSNELAAHCVDSLAYALQDRGR